MSEASPVPGTSLSHNASTKNEGGAFLRAAYEGDTQRVLKMIHTGTPVDISNTAGLQALHFAAKSGHVELASELIKHGAQVNALTLKGNTPLHVAALLGQKEVIKLLLRRGADVNKESACNEDLFTPLYMAAQIGHQEIVTLLLAHGAHPSLATKNGSTPRDVAHQQGHQVVAEILEEYERRTQGGASEEGPTGELTENEAVTQPESECAVGGSLILSPNGRLKSGPPPVYNDVIPSPKHSPLRTRSNKVMNNEKDQS